MKTNIYPPPIYRLDKINNYIKAKLDDYLRDSKEMSKGAFEKTIFMRMFFENEIEQSKILLLEVGQINQNQNLDPYSMSFARASYGYAKDYELIHLEKEFFKFYIISLEKHLDVLLKSLDKIQPGAAEAFDLMLNRYDKIFKNDFAYTLFDKMKGHYTDTKTPQADFSFLFDIMQKESFVICSGVKFIDMLKDFDISITKIDSSKTGNKRKTTLYNATKENLQKKHGLSTM